MSLLTVHGLTKSFGSFTAVDHVDLELEAGILTSIIGPNGAGKTTLINCLTGSLPVDQGRILFHGQDITRLPPERRVRRGIARSFQITNIFAQLSVAQNVFVPVLARQGRTLRPFLPYHAYEDAVEEVEGLLRELGLWELRDMPAGKLSHGDQRRLEIAMAVAPRPGLCFLDEPTSGMNPLERTEVLRVIQGLAGERGLTFVVIEHDMDLVFALSQRIVVLHRGEVLAQGTPAEIRENRLVREIYLGEEVPQ